MTKTMIVLAALAASVGFAPISNAQDMAKDTAYCRLLIEQYEGGSAGAGARTNTTESLATTVAIDQCRSGNPEPAIPVLQERLRANGFTVPARS
jgi:hypothetical protein